MCGGVENVSGSRLLARGARGATIGNSFVMSVEKSIKTD